MSWLDEETFELSAVLTMDDAVRSAVVRELDAVAVLPYASDRLCTAVSAARGAALCGTLDRYRSAAVGLDDVDRGMLRQALGRVSATRKSDRLLLSLLLGALD